MPGSRFSTEISIDQPDHLLVAIPCLFNSRGGMLQGTSPGHNDVHVKCGNKQGKYNTANQENAVEIKVSFLP